MCLFCQEHRIQDFNLGPLPAKLWLDEEEPTLLKLRLPVEGVWVTKPIHIQYCPLCGANLAPDSEADISPSDMKGACES